MSTLQGIHESPFHRYYTCAKNRDISHKNVSDTQNLAKKVADDIGTKSNFCKWFRAILPSNLVGPPTGWVDEGCCDAVEVGGSFSSILDRTRTAGSDGAGGKDKQSRTRIVGSGSAVFDPIAGTVRIYVARTSFIGL